MNQVNDPSTRQGFSSDAASTSGIWGWGARGAKGGGGGLQVGKNHLQAKLDKLTTELMSCIRVFFKNLFI